MNLNEDRELACRTRICSVHKYITLLRITLLRLLAPVLAACVREGEARTWGVRVKCTGQLGPDQRHLVLALQRYRGTSPIRNRHPL